ncbi:DUF2479 domain-containing protein, partial [Clostridium botulinum C/D]|nr:DUF2479 domain-containing protein [Clostridium botulinum C/D]MCD3214893.1 DUF2479 domain-containing protein [Clostridium botulinum C/D]MCD3237598.1 DUF2479 domain-containing protein [Clostridium botulinum C/D]MCD3243569.1 DUF2479 domain-containing protein [Clostridium botulinum C/D]MCD3259978.1 DUF2479 domain-containing protein [Clostridium botulinum C/D]
DEKNKIDIKDNTCHIVNTKQDLIGIYQKPIDMDLRYDYSLSFDVKCDKKADMLIGFSMTGITVKVDDTKGEWVRVKKYVGKPLRLTNDIVLYAKEGSEVYIRNAKVEKGFVATDWSIAPEEIIANSKRLDVIEQVLIEKGFNIAKNKLN